MEIPGGQDTLEPNDPMLQVHFDRIEGNRPAAVVERCLTKRR
jgi:hypothetical protein